MFTKLFIKGQTSKYIVARRWKNRKGFLLEPLTWALIGIAYMTAALWGWMVYSADKLERDPSWF